MAFRLQDWPSALTNYQKVLTALDESDNESRTDVYYRLGCIKREQGQAKQAVNNFEKALGLNNEHRPTLEALVAMYATGNDWKQVAAYKRQILDSVYEGDERFKILGEIGEIWAEKEKNPGKAIEALEEALELKPQDHVLLHKLLSCISRQATGRRWWIPCKPSRTWKRSPRSRRATCTRKRSSTGTTGRPGSRRGDLQTKPWI